MFETVEPVAGADVVPDAPIAWAEFEPGGWILDLICAEPVSALDDDGVLDRVAALERIRSLVDAEQCAALAEFARRRADDEFGASVGDEVGLALRIASRTADRRIEAATRLVERLPATVSAMRRGAVTHSKARALAEETDQLCAADAATVEATVLDRAAESTPGQLRRRTARAVIRIDPAAAAARRRTAETDRSVWLRPDACGMATLGARLCAADAVGIFELLDQTARSARAAGDARTLQQLRADILVQRVGGAALAASRPLVQIVVPAAAVVDDCAAPAELAGYGPVDHELAREIIATGVWQRLTADPSTGTVTDIGRKRYRPPAALADLVRARGRTCAFPTCERAATRCDLDHRHRWSAGGTTSAANLWPLCRRHHAIKDGDPGWSCELRPDGVVTWTTPAGRVYSVERDIDQPGVSRITVTDPAQPQEHAPDRDELPAPF
ncbi:MAG: HNH endonuclease [Pseudonocardiales bacterium]|nr:MAG: HNH endonuclease [Pseudonocardiales bacterium]